MEPLDGAPVCLVCKEPATWRSPAGYWACEDCKRTANVRNYSLDELLAEVVEWLGRFVAYPTEHHKLAHALWILHAHAMECWASTPRLAFLSPEPGSGKTRALEVTEPLVPRPVNTVNVTPAYLFRKVGTSGTELPTLLFDEIDTVFGPKARENEEIRGLLNAGHRKGAVAGRCVVVGKIVKTEELPAYCAVLLAGLGDLPDTIISRSIVVRMRRRAPGEVIEPYRQTIQELEGQYLRDRIAAAIEPLKEELEKARPVMPEGVEDREADKWEPLLVVADAAGGEWPQKARVTVVTLVTLSKVATPSLGIRLLEDLRTIFGDSDAMSTEQIIKALTELEEAPWGDLYGKPLNARGLAQRLHKYEVPKSKTVRVEGLVARGYTREDLWDAWNRYLAPLPLISHDSPPQGESVTSVTNVTTSLFDEGPDDDDFEPSYDDLPEPW